MIKKQLVTLALSCLFFAGHAQNYEPLELAQKIFVTGHFNSFQKYSKGEYRENNGHPNLNDFEPGLKKTFSLLDKTDNEAVVVMTVADSLNQSTDTYLHFEKDSIWKMVAFRGLALTGIVEAERNELRQLTPKQVDSILNRAKQKPEGINLFSTREEYKFELGNTTLWLSSDDSIVAHFQRNKTRFNAIRDSAFILIQKGLGTKQLSDQYRKLFITAVTKDTEGFTNSINFVINGITDNVVGYVFIKNKADVPRMSPDGIIMLRPIGDGWYIYKTT